MTLKNSTNEHKNSSSEQKNSSNQPQKIVPMNIKNVIWTKKNCAKEQKKLFKGTKKFKWTKNSSNKRNNGLMNKKSSNEQTNLIQMKINFFLKIQINMKYSFIQELKQICHLTS